MWRIYRKKPLDEEAASAAGFFLLFCGTVKERSGHKALY
jgi:hypothetical protein